MSSGGGNLIGGQDVSSLDPVLTQAVVGPSPTEERAATISADKNVQRRLAQANAAGPTIRQKTQSETIDLLLLRSRLGNPFSIRWIPFEQLRDMTTDVMLAFGWWSTIGPLIRADFYMEGPDAQLNAAVDEAYRQIHVQTLLSMSNDLWYGHQPLVKQFKLGRLGATYRDPNGKDPTADLPVWSSSADALLWKAPATLNPSHCLPMWNDDGQMTGFKFSNMPIPHFDLISAASAYGYMVIPGHEINSDYAVWTSNETELEFGSCFGSARAKRSFPFWWSYWFRYHVADRTYENVADPPKYVYYPVDFDQFIDPDDPNQENPVTRQARATAISVGEQMRSGATIAFPGSFAEGQDGRGTPHRKWEAGYFKPPNNFAELDATLRILDIQKLRAWFVPEQARVEGAGTRTAGGSAGGTGGARMVSQLADVQEESQQPLVGRYDAYINDHFIPQFIAANFPEKIGTPCKKVTRALGEADDQTLAQVLQLVGQVRGEVIPVDIRAVLSQLNIPLLNKKQMEAEIKEISKLAQIMGPAQSEPTPRGTQGYNAGVGKRQDGSTFYYEPPQRIVLSERGDFMSSLPDTPHFQDPTSRAQTLKLRQILKKRYEEQYTSLVSFLAQQPTLHLAQKNGDSGLNEDQAKASAAAIITAWAGTQAPGVVGSAQNLVADGLGLQLAQVLTKVALAGGASTLKGARLRADDFDEAAVQDWVQDRVKFLLSSVDETVRDEARDWLAGELRKSVDPDDVAEAAKEHFEDFPATHSDRAARTETVDNFNRGAAEAAERAGVAQMQIHDASDGTDTRTDAPCIARNGKIVSTAEAKNVRTMHPRCSVFLTPLSTEKFSVQRVLDLPDHVAGAGKHVAYDPVKEILYLDEKVDDATETAALLMLGQELALR